METNKKSGITILLFDKINIKVDHNKGQRKTPHNDKWLNPQEDITLVSINVPNTET